MPHTLTSPAKLVALREQKHQTLAHSHSSSDLRSVGEDAVMRTDGGGGGGGGGSGGVGGRSSPTATRPLTNGTPKTPPRPNIGRLRRRSTLEWVSATPQTRQEKWEGVTRERMAHVFFSLHVPGVQGGCRWRWARHARASGSSSSGG